jgi:prepilin-type N-terminal cleavage/methylation domain-containing protein
MTVPTANFKRRLFAARPSRKRPGFTLIEVLATLMLMAIVLPAIMQGISIASGTASAARCRNEAAGLAESKLNEVVATQQWQGGQMSGDFAPDFPQYHWQATVGDWQSDNSNVGLQQLDLKVIWTYRNREDSVTVSTLTYVRAQQ